MKLAIFATHPVQYQAPWFRALVRSGIAVEVLYGLIPDAQQQASGFGGAFSWDVPLLEGYSWKALRQMRREPSLAAFGGLRCRGVGTALADSGADVAILTGWNSFYLIQGLAAAMRLGIPTVVRGDSNSLRPRPVRVRAGHRVLLSCYDAFVAVGRANRTFYESNGVHSEDIVDGGHWVDEEHFLAEAARHGCRRDEIRASWGIEPGACCFLFAGKLEQKKRPLDFLSALGRIASRRPGLRMHGLVVGSGEMEPVVREAAEAASASVTFAGFLNQREIGRAYAAGDVLVLPSDWGETWGLVVNEAMLFGRPAIVSDRVGCGPDLVRNGKTGFVFPFGDVEALASAMEATAVSEKLRYEIGREAKSLIRGYAPSRGAAATIAASRIALGIG